MGSSEAASTSLEYGKKLGTTPEPASPRLELRERVRRLNGSLGHTLVSALAGSADPQHARAWVTGASDLGPEAAQRLRTAYAVWRKVAEAEGDAIARAWFVGANPWLDDDSPVNALRDGRMDAVARAADATVEDSFSG